MSAYSTWTEQIVHIEYNDSRILGEELAKLYGPGNFRIKIQASAYRLTIPTPLLPAQLNQINDKIRAHYHPQDR
ncbi:hypothetical protein F4782DRAFT_517588 [Xylaria castorea]|nr:hypothetical protein F4782DRAFT_517588 [Xylaria castorea]